MRLVVQRVLNATLTSQGKIVSKIENGLMVLCGITHTDNEVDIDNLVPKLLGLKLWDHKEKAWSGNVVDMGFQILFVS
jgi:D-aminoacyl-tRNA deacylase